jgi:hypothetical protein
LEKNYCFLGWSSGPRNGDFLCEQINSSIDHLKEIFSDYKFPGRFDLENSISHDPEYGIQPNHTAFNALHRVFEDLQGVNGSMSPYYTRADDVSRWHIRQLNLLCHESESWILSHAKSLSAPEWARPSQLMCWLNAPRFELTPDDLDLFGIDTINRPLGGVFVGVNKAVGKHHYEVFSDEGDRSVDELTTRTLRSQTLACGDFDIEWANDPGAYHWQKTRLARFRAWLVSNGFDPEDKSLTIGHPQVAQVDLAASFGTTDYRGIWLQLAARLNVISIRTSQSSCEYPYTWADTDYQEQQIRALKQ